MKPHQAALWIDHQEAHVFHVDPYTFTASLVRAPQHAPSSARNQALPHDHTDDEHDFFAEVAQSLAGSDSVLVVGPDDTKLHFRDYAETHASILSFAIAGIETVDHPTNKEVAAFVRRYFGDQRRPAAPAR